jgi:hypothetical protein
MHKILIIAVLFILVAACSSLQPEPTTTPIPPTPTQQTEVVEYGVVTFDGSECTHSGPSEVPVGEYTFVFKNESDLGLGFYLNQILEGKTFQDLQDWQLEPGVYLPPPSWIAHPSSYYSSTEGTTVHILDKAGLYATLIGNNTSLWFCGPFEVVEVPSE